MQVISKLKSCLSIFGKPIWPILLLSFLLSLTGAMTGHNELCSQILLVVVIAFLIWQFPTMLRHQKVAKALNNGEFKQVLELLQDEIKNNSKNPLVCSQLALAYVGLRQTTESLKLIEKGLSTNSHYSSLYCIRASVYMQLNQCEQSLQDCDRAIELAKGSINTYLSELWALRSATLGRLGKFTDGIEDATKALTLNPKCATALINRAYSYCMVGEYKKALADLDTMTKLPLEKLSMAYMLSNRARVNALTENLSAAEQDSEDALNLFPNDPSLLATRGLVLFKRQQNEEALTVLSKAIEIESHHADAHWLRHLVYKALNNIEKSDLDKELAFQNKYHVGSIS